MYLIIFWLYLRMPTLGRNPEETELQLSPSIRSR
jgi:hypothetical protein